MAVLLTYAREAALGLAYLHSAGIIHCDVKPENLLVADDGRLRVGAW